MISNFTFSTFDQWAFIGSLLSTNFSSTSTVYSVKSANYQTENKNCVDLYLSIAGPNIWNQLPSHIRLSKSIDVLKDASNLWLLFYWCLMLCHWYIQTVALCAINFITIFYSHHTVYIHVLKYFKGCIIRLYYSTLPLVYPFMHICTLYFMHSAR